MKKVWDFIWSFDLIFKKNDPRLLIALQGIGIAFLSYLLLYPFFSDPIKTNGTLFDTKEIILMSAYIIVLVGGTLYNYKFIERTFFKNIGSAIMITIGRMLVLITIEWFLMFLIKFVCMVFFKISPIHISDYSYLTDVIFYFPLFQLCYFFYRYRKNSYFEERRHI